jgi:16S rRNA (uracil1498-N3)-methyltransferase
VTARPLFLPPERIGQGEAELTPEARHYLRDVLRLEAGAELELFDGRGGAYPAVLLAGHERLRLGLRREARPALALWLLVALARGEKLDLVVQKATELGAACVLAFGAERSVVRLDAGRGEARAGRWARIAAEASRQCGRADVPEVRLAPTLAAALAEVPRGFALLAFDPAGEPLSALSVTPAGVAAVIGPEGGLTPEEVRACEAAGARTVGMGPRVLRAETAALAAAVLIQARFGDMV